MNMIVRQIVMLAAMLAIAIHASGCVQVKSNVTAEEIASLVSPKRLKGNGKIVAKSIDVPEFTRISAHRSADVTLVAGDVKQIQVRADENVMPYLVITCQRGELNITIDDAIKNVGDITFEVAVPMNKQISHLRSTSAAEIEVQEGLTLTVEHTLKLDASSAAKIKGSYGAKELSAQASSAAEIDGCFRAAKVEMDASSSADIEGSVMAEQLTANASSAATIELEGTASRARMQASSAADIECEDLVTTQCTAEASSAAEVCCHCTGDLKASAFSGGSVRYEGNPATTEFSKSSGGSVHPAN